MIKLTAKHWLMLLSLLFFAPLGLFLVIRHYRFRRTVNWVLAAVFVPLFAAECAFFAVYFVARDLQRMPQPAIAVSAESTVSSDASSQSEQEESSRDEPEAARSEPESPRSEPAAEPAGQEPSSEAGPDASEPPSEPETSTIEPEPPQSEPESSQPDSVSQPPAAAPVSPPKQSAQSEIPADPGKPMPAPGTPGPGSS